MEGRGLLVKVPVQIYKLHDRAEIPTKARMGDAGYDLYILDDITVSPGHFIDVHTGICLGMPQDGSIWARITGRSSTIRNWRLQVQEGIIDGGYTGEVFIGVWNHTADAINVPRNTRLAQIIFHQNIHADWLEIEEIPDGERGSRGFGSSGT